MSFWLRRRLTASNSSLAKSRGWWVSQRGDGYFDAILPGLADFPIGSPSSRPALGWPEAENPAKSGDDINPEVLDGNP
jgi:hypothetical protein